MTWAPHSKSSTQRGYGVAHRRARAQWQAIVDAGQAICCLCGHPIAPGADWHLDHTPDRTGYRGAACAGCNVRDAAQRARARQDPPRRLVL